MEVNRISFNSRLLDILDDLTKCHFVALDLELSGIPTHRAKKPTIQERYTDIKAAAERYQVLQIGLTFAIHDWENDCYILKPYNMNINPMLEERLDVERDFTFSSSALDFLFRNGFDLQEIFNSGVPYLSPEESKTAKEAAYKRFQRNIGDIELEEDNEEAHKLLDEVRQQITLFKRSSDEELYLVVHEEETGHRRYITSWNAKNDDPIKDSLSRYEKRLIHQLIRAEYPDLVTFGREKYMQVIYLNEEREKEVLRKKKHGVKEQIKRQTGFQWIVDAMLGKTLHRLDVSTFAYHDNGAPKAVNPSGLQSRFELIKEILKTKRPVLVGHNCFLDFVYFYHSFIGPLPDTIEEFEAALHSHFPVVIDTKYMATHNCGGLNPTSSLSEIENKLLLQDKPNISMICKLNRA